MGRGGGIFALNINFIYQNAHCWLFTGGLITFSSCFGQTFFIAVFSKNIMQEFNLTFSEWGGIYAVATLAGGFLIIWVGSIADIFRARDLSIVFLLILALNCLVMAYNTSVLLLPMLIFAIRFCGQAMLTHIGFTALSRWYRKDRGKALAVGYLGLSCGEALLPIVFVTLMVYFDWRLLWNIVGIILILFCPLMLYLLNQERRPKTLSLESSDATGMDNRHWTRKQLLRHWLFWAILPSIINPSMFITVLFFQQIHLAEIKQWSHASFVFILPIYTFSTMLAMLMIGYLIDRFGAIRLLPFFQLPMAFGFLLFAVADTLTMGAMALVFIAMMQGGNFTIMNAVWAEFYGTAHLGSIKSLVTALVVFGSAFSPWLSGYLIDSGISFEQQMPFYSVYIVIVSVIIFFSCQKVLTLPSDINIKCPITAVSWLCRGDLENKRCKFWCL